MRKKILKTIILTLSIDAILLILMILFSFENKFLLKILSINTKIFIFCIPALCCSILYEKTNIKGFSTIGMILSLICCICNILFNFDGNFFLLIQFLCFSFGHLSLILLINNKQEIVKNFKSTTIISSIILDIFISIAFFCDISNSDFLIKLLFILGIVTFTGTIITPILNKFHKDSICKFDYKDDSEYLFDEQDTKYDNLEKLKEMLNSNQISQEEYDKEKYKILNFK